MLISKKKANDPFFDCEWFAIESLNDVGDVEIYLLKQMEELFEYWIDEFIEQEYLQKPYMCIVFGKCGYMFQI